MTAITVESASGFREEMEWLAPAPLIIRVEDEYMIVTDVEGDTLTVVDAREWMEYKLSGLTRP